MWPLNDKAMTGKLLSLFVMKLLNLKFCHVNFVLILLKYRCPSVRQRV